eukprot:6182884-Pleurochrysis_carterae.AAC.2
MKRRNLQKTVDAIYVRLPMIAPSEIADFHGSLQSIGASFQSYRCRVCRLLAGAARGPRSTHANMHNRMTA